ncbi:hypothetical protein J8I87_30710 [Paraburkholderia sp. LEh10]|uniref:hypothetical protein n=1 Tax=Paraburkholderia sp. LEh10 TaxID=2821353 RepID=UPI001AE54161|nr:hypothetical protein [Paraburkholderia sp. LEh10]MBP0593974.1 hypothetical protein [Paraburkholderia sp. LEh10]
MKHARLSLRCLRLAIVGIASSIVFPLGACAAGPSQADAHSGCRFEPPASWNFTVIRWSGPCSADGVADGRGVLRGYADGRVAETFFGELRRGYLSIGVIETESGYIAGKFVEGRLFQDQERRDVIAAFEIAAKAAQQMSEMYWRNGNTTSSGYYARKARGFREQMD